MLDEYRRYLTNVRNNLIQCGVEFPISPLEDYRDLFRVGIQLDEVLWFYSILSISGSENALKGYFIPLSVYYKEQMRQMFYKEFLEYVKDYRKLSAMNYELGGVDNEIAVPSLNVSIAESEVVDLFEDVEEDVESVLLTNEEDGILLERVDSSIISLVPEVEGEITPIEPEIPVHSTTYTSGLMLDDLIEENEKSTSGIFLDELEDEDSQGSAFEIEYEEDEEDSTFVIEYENKENENGITYSKSGLFLDELILEEENQVSFDDEDDVNEDIDEDEEEDDMDYISSLSDLEETSESEELYDANGFLIVEDDENEIADDEDEGQYDENGFLIVEDDENEVVDEYEGQYDENGFLIVEDDEDDISDCEEDEPWVTDLEEEIIPKPQKVVPTKQVKTDKDISDLLQDWTNNILTKGKKSILGSIGKLKDE